MIDIGEFQVSMNSNIRDGIKQMDNAGFGFIVIIDDNHKVVGIVTDGDFRRAVLSGVALNQNIMQIANKHFQCISKNYSKSNLEKFFNKGSGVELLPVLDDGKLINIINKDDIKIIKGKKVKNESNLDLPVVIMAGGKGTRLDPFTRILPKALIPIGEKPIIEIIMDEYANFGMKDFYLSVFYKDKMIKAYFDNEDVDYSIKYIEENKPLGSAGALKLIDGVINGPFFMSNCDIIVKTDYDAIYNFHKDNGFDLTIVTSMKQFTIPYGVCTHENQGSLKTIYEKPEFDFLVNTGMYLINASVLKYIPENEPFDMVSLVNKIKENNINVGVFPVSDKSWIDVGQWEQYKQSINNFKV